MGICVCWLTMAARQTLRQRWHSIMHVGASAEELLVDALPPKCTHLNDELNNGNNNNNNDENPNGDPE